jgi:hypothetical protein
MPQVENQCRCNMDWRSPTDTRRLLSVGLILLGRPTIDARKNEDSYVL